MGYKTQQLTTHKYSVLHQQQPKRFCCMKALAKIAFQAPEIAISGGITNQEECVTYFT